MRVQRTLICGVKGYFNKILGSAVLKRFTLKALITTTADGTLKHFGFFCCCCCCFFFFRENT